MKFNVTLMSPPGYLHGLGLLEAVEYLNSQIIRSGYKSIITKNRLIHDGINVILGANINPERFLNLPNNCIIFNSEQLSASKNDWISTQYKEILFKNYVWEYSNTNLKLIPHNNKSLLEFNFDPSLRRIKMDQTKEWDIVFYGSMSERRKKILDALESRGLRVKRIFGIYGSERDEFLSKSRAVINLHYYDSQILQQIRIFYPLINKIPVISENYPANTGPECYENYIFTPGNLNFEDYVVDLLQNDDLFQKSQYEKITLYELTANNFNFKNVLLNTIDYITNIKSTINSKINKINLGSGKDYKIGYLNIDINKNSNPDILLDLSQNIKFPIELNCETYGKLIMQENQYDEIIAFDVLEHVKYLDILMSNCLKLLTVGGKFIISVPYDLSCGAWQDPTHVRAFNQNSWLYYTDWFWYLSWFKYKFEVQELNFIPSAYGKSLIEKNIGKETILNTPRAIDSMSVILVKRETSYEEKNLARSFSNNLIDIG